MANIGHMNAADRRATLRTLLLRRGMSPQEADAQLEWLRTESAILADLEFHNREDEAIKAGQPLPAYEMVEHYIGPLHRLSGNRAEVLAQGTELEAPEAPPPPPPPQQQSGLGFTPRQIMGGALAVALLGVVTYVGVIGAARSRAQRS